LNTGDPEKNFTCKLPDFYQNCGKPLPQKQIDRISRPAGDYVIQILSGDRSEEHRKNKSIGRS
jgi:hypothetical protein